MFCLAYLDDIMIYSKDEESHKEHVRRVLKRLRANGLYVKLEKCEFHVDTVGFVRCVISLQGVSIEDDCVESVRNWL